MGTIGARRLQRKSLSSKRAQQSVETIEASIGRTISSDTSDNSTSEEASCQSLLADDNEGSVDKAD